MALRLIISLRAARLTSTSSLVSAAVLWSSVSPLLDSTRVSAFSDQKRSYAKMKKSKGGKDKPSASAGVEPNDDDNGNEDGGAAKALEKAKRNMKGAVVNFTRALNQMRPGRADAGVFDELHVQAYGQHVPLSQVAQVAVVGTYALSVSIYDPSLMLDVKKAIESTNPVYSVREEANCLEISFPKMSKETRAELLKSTKKQAEQARQHVRRVRQDAMNHAKKLKEAVSEDAVEAQKERIQKITDDATAEIAKLLEAKEKDLTTV